MESGRSYRIDALKGIAIIAVVLYHFGGGYLTYGYLGVDIFFVVSGYFMMKSIAKAMQENRFSYWRFIASRVARLWPLILIMTALALGLGLFAMLPDDLENLSESVIASNVFANNVLSCITTRNYWDIANVFKPLMHTWYVGVLMQAYVLLPLIYLGVFKLAKGNMNAVKISVVAITLISLIAYLLPVATTAEKFYYLPFRTFEITMGSLIIFTPNGKRMTTRMQYITEAACFGIILFLLCADIAYPLASLKLLLIVCATTALIYLFVNTKEKPVIFVEVISYIGRASFSIYLCHQIVVAYMYYAVTDRSDPYVLMIFIAVVFLLSVVIYLMVEKPLELVVKKNVLYVLVPSVAVCLTTSAISGMIYLHAGVVRDVPELGIEKANVHRGMHAEYCDIPYSWDKDFESTDKVKIAVIGDSFGRDWANILNESPISDRIEISYIYSRSIGVYEDNKDRLLEADVVFRTFSSSTADIDDDLPNIVPDDKLYIVGYKNFGSSNGIIYSQRKTEDYFDQTIALDDEVLRNNQILSERYGDHYIDMIGAVQDKDGLVRVFTDDRHFISQDCRHLTKFGAQYYARIMDLSWITEKSNN